MAEARLVTFNGETVTPQDDAILYQSATIDGVFRNAEFTISTSTNIHVGGTFAIMGGRFIEIPEQDITISLATTSGGLVGQIYLYMDLSNVDSPLNLTVETASTEGGLTPMITDELINIDNGVYSMQLCKFGVNTTTVFNLEDPTSTDLPVTCRILPKDALEYTAEILTNLNTTVTGMGVGKTLKTLKQEDGLISATFQNISITKSQVSDFAHTHGNITNDGKLNADVAKASGDKFVLTDASDSNKIVRSNIALGTSTSTYLRNDGAWGTPANTTYSAGDGLSLSGTTFSSVDHINQASKLVNANWGNPTTYSWTATANGWLVIKAENNTIEYYIDNVKIGSIGNYEFSQPIPVKKGQVIKAINSDNRVTNNNFTVYACK